MLRILKALISVDFWAFLALLAGAMLMVAPFLWMFSSSLRPLSEAFALPPNWLPPSPLEWQIENYTSLFDMTVPFSTFFLNSVKIAAPITAGMVLTASLSGYAFAKLRFPGRNFLFLLFLTSLMVPIQVTIIPLFTLMSKLDLVDSHWALILPGLLGAYAPGISGAFGVFFMRQFFLTLPQDILDAARIDGAGRWGTFWRIALPLAKPSMTSLGIIVFAMTWNDYFLPLVFLGSLEKMVLPLGILAIREPFSSGSSTMLAAVTLSISPVLIIFLIGQRWIVDSFVRAGVKG